MVKFLIVTHGTLADGFKSTMSILMGEEVSNKIETINAYVRDNEDPKTLIESYIANAEDTLVVFTDIMYGSVNQFALNCPKKDNVYIITGVNLPLIMEIVSKAMFVDGFEITKEFIRETIEKSKEQIIYVDDNSMKEETTEEDFFE